MPLTAEQLTALDALQGADPADLATAFHEKHGKAAQTLIDQGDTGATKRAGAEIRKAEKALKDEQEAHAATRKKLEDGDPAKVHEKYQAEITDLKTKHDTEVKGLKAQGIEREQSRDLAQLEARLSPKLRPMALRAVLNDPETRKLLQYDEDGTRRVLQRGKDIPYAAAKDQNPLDLLAADLVEHVKTLDADSVLAPVTTGGGTGGEGSGAGGYDPVAAGKEMAKQQKGEEGQRGLALR
jgi:hypothetical protein